jgi:hypothetical protein
MKKPDSKLTPEEKELRYGTEFVGTILQKLDIRTPTNTAEIEAFNKRMDEIFGLSEIQDKFVPVRYLLVCESLGIKSITLIGFKALLPNGGKPTR